MSGLAGLIRLDGQAVDTTSLQATLRRLRHRGSGAEGLATDGGLGLGHRVAKRGPGGRTPPIQLARQGGFFVLDGHIHNTEALCRQLGRDPAPGESDSDVLAEWLDAGGDLQSLNGVFALAWWRPQRGELWLVRDRYGVKPLFWTRLPGQLAIASEPQAFRALDDFQARPNRAMVWEYLVAAMPCGEEGLWEGVYSVPAGSLLCIDLTTGPGDPVRIFEIPAGGPEPDTAELHAALSDVLRRQCPGNQSLALALSGGLDSSVLAALCPEAGLQPQCFNVSWEEDHPIWLPSVRGDDSESAEEAAEALGLNLHSQRLPDELDLAAVQKAVARKGLPLCDTSELAMDALFRNLGAHAAVALTGDGADELFCGYHFFASGDKALPWMSVRTAVLADLLRPELATDALSILRERSRQVRYSSLREGLLLYFLPHLLERLDRFSTAHGVELRLPFLDDALIPFAVGPKDYARYRKAPLRAVGARLLPESLAQRPTSVFPPSRGEGLSLHAQRALGVALRSEGLLQDLLRPSALGRLVRAAGTGFEGRVLVWRLLNLQLWSRWLAG